MYCWLKTIQDHRNIRLSKLYFERVAVLTGEITRDSTIWDFKMWPLAVVTGDRINEGFLCENVWPFFHR